MPFSQYSPPCREAIFLQSAGGLFGDSQCNNFSLDRLLLIALSKLLSITQGKPAHDLPFAHLPFHYQKQVDAFGGDFGGDFGGGVVKTVEFQTRLSIGIV